MIEKDVWEERMNTENEVVIDYRTSPAVYHDGMNIRVLNLKRSCTQGDIISAIEKGILTESDLCVMDVLYRQHYMTRFTLTESIRIDGTIPDGYKKKNYKQSLAKLVKHGIVLRYSMEWMCAEQMHATPCFYMLSRNAYEYVGHIYHQNSVINKLHTLGYTSPPVVSEVLEMAVFNQFHAQILKLHRDKLSNYYINLGIRGNKINTNIHGVYTFYTENTVSKRLNLVTIPVRSQEGWLALLEQRITCIEGYVNKENALFKEPFYLFLCENSEQARSVDSVLWKRFTGLPYLYLIDQSLVEGDIMGKLFRIQELGNNNYQFVLQELNL